MRLHDDNAVAVAEKTSAKGEARLPAYFYRLPPKAQRVYLKSDAIDRFDFVPSDAAFKLSESLVVALETGASSTVERAAQRLLDELSRLTAVSAVRIEVRNVRPHNTRGELHGIFYPRGPSTKPRSPLIILWMRTAQRHDVVKPKTFLRTLMHEFGHYLDYALLRLGGSPHTSGFFRRESFLVRTLWQTT